MKTIGLWVECGGRDDHKCFVVIARGGEIVY
jgi:hypothetical protein